MSIKNKFQIKSHKVQLNFKMRDMIKVIRVKAKKKVFIIIYNNNKIHNCKIYINKKLSRFKLRIKR